MVAQWEGVGEWAKWMEGSGRYRLLIMECKSHGNKKHIIRSTVNDALIVLRGNRWMLPLWWAQGHVWSCWITMLYTCNEYHIVCKLYSNLKTNKYLEKEKPFLLLWNVKKEKECKDARIVLGRNEGSWLTFDIFDVIMWPIMSSFKYMKGKELQEEMEVEESERGLVLLLCGIFKGVQKRRM